MLSHAFESANDASAAQRAIRNTAPNMSLDQQLQLMNNINNMVKNGQFTAQLANHVFTLCAQLKNSGILLENTHKNELNKVFVSLRQACCRDNGQLGTPCRLKIMELVELRAMHWRSNLAHSQYYVNRPEQQPESTPISMASTASTPTSQPQAFVPQSPLFMHQDMQATNPGFYLIPAAGGWMPPILQSGMVPQNPFLPQAPVMPHEALLMRQRSIKKTTPKAMQLRHEMIIRNSDSGKIMGVKGRRVALVEQLTNTVISFQKVDPKSKERTLTITANSSQDIERAKDLIIDTIRRNMSPCRPDVNSDSGITTTTSSATGEGEEDEDDNDISIETTQDGMLKLCCSDPAMLQAAQEALSEYLRVRARPSAEEREKRKERRKSMPLQQSQPESGNLKASRSFHGSTPNLAEPAALATSPTVANGNGTAVSAAGATNGNWSTYNRDDICRLRDSSTNVDDIRRSVAAVAPELLR